ncbi:hypothetical protein [Streptomyces sp. NPDC058623]|uniref:hypothetical protein n=1 Tax=Streptomyces sp. NPDC058623 TaxID=3346563 RepID=UPI00364A4F34
MQLRRAALPLSLLALLASAGCVSVGPESGAADPVRGSTPPLGRQDAAEGRLSDGGPPERPLPLSVLPDPESETPPPGTGPGDRQQRDASDDGPDHTRDAQAAAPRARKADPPARRHAKPPAPRRVRPAKPTPPRVPRPAAPRLPRGEELCAAAEGTVPPSVVDLCVRQYGH